MPSLAKPDRRTMRENGTGGGGAASVTIASVAPPVVPPAPLAETASGATPVVLGAGGSNGNPGPDGAANCSPLRQGIIVIEHKIRNLEKRKSKLESYRDLQKSGKDLNQDQKVAVAKYDEVVQTLDFARDLCKSFISIALMSEKDEKKKARKEAIARSQTELAKIREVLLVQDALINMGIGETREDFLNGRNGAAQLTQADIKLLDDLYPAVNPKHEAGDPTAFMPQVQAAAEHLLAIVDGKPKEAFGSTYAQIKEVIGKIHESGYFDQAAGGEVFDAQQQAESNGDTTAINGDHSDAPAVESAPSTVQEPLRPPMPVVDPAIPISMEVMQHKVPPQLAAAAPPMVPAPEQMFYAGVPPVVPPQAPAVIPIQQRPITEVIGKSTYLFLQESELDTPPEQIPTQTFTNQQYVAGSAPPPSSIPMPTHFHQQYPPVAAQLPPPIQPQHTAIPPQTPVVPPASIVQQQQQQSPPNLNNGVPGEQGRQHHQSSSHRNGPHHHRHQPQQQQQQQRSHNNSTNNHSDNNRPYFANNGYNRSNNSSNGNNKHRGPSGPRPRNNN